MYWLERPLYHQTIFAVCTWTVGLALAAWPQARAGEETQQEAPAAVPSQPATRIAERWPAPATQLEVAPDAKPLVGGLETTALNDVRPAGFQDVVPGQTTADQVRELLGEPLEQFERDEALVVIYRVGPFPKVEVVVAEQIVQALVIHLDDTPRPAEMAKELELAGFRPARIVDEQGQLLGQVFPERGVLFSFAAGAEEPRVAQVLLEQIAAEPFVLRAEQHLDHDFTQCLADLERAAKIDPQDARVPWLQAQVLAAVGRPDEALRLADRAVRLQPSGVEYRLCKAQLLARQRDPARAIELTRAVLEESNVAGELQARAQCQLGDLLATGPQPDYPRAIEHHLAAIQLATPLATSRQVAVRQAAKRVLIEAHLAVGLDVARGNWRKKEQVVPQWLQTAMELAEGFVLHDHGEPRWELRARRQALAAYAALNGSMDPSRLAADLLEHGQRALAVVDDPLYQEYVQRELGEGLLDAARIEHARGNYPQAMQHATSALSYLNQLAQQKETTAQDDHLLGRVYFTVGALYAVRESDHATAVTWYDRAQARLSRPETQVLLDKAVHGDRLVTMAVSYWGKGEYERGVRLTQQGIALIRQAVDSGMIESHVLAIPYGNLATMHRKLGNEAEAKHFSDLAARMDAPAAATVGRRVISD